MKKLLFILLFIPFIINAQDYYLHAGKLFDSRDGKILKNMTIIVSGKKITAVKKGFEYSKNNNDVIIDLKDFTVMPGFIDLHVHIESEYNPEKYLNEFTAEESQIAFSSLKFAKRTLMAGFTTVRDLGGSGVNISLRNAINKGEVDGPRIFTAGKAIGTTGGHADPTNGWKKSIAGNPGPSEGVINGTDDARKAVRQRYKNGADVIKITATGGVMSIAKNGQNPQFTIEEIKAICETAEDYDMIVAAHAHGDEGIQRAVVGGVHTIEHGTLLSAKSMELMKEYGTYYVPTITAADGGAEYNVAVGSSAMLNMTIATQNVAIGRQAMGLGIVTGAGNVAVGYISLYDLTSGTHNTAIGTAAPQNLLTGASNTAIGRAALNDNTTGGSNTAIGMDSLRANTTASNNTATYTLSNSAGCDSVVTLNLTINSINIDAGQDQSCPYLCVVCTSSSKFQGQ